MRRATHNQKNRIFRKVILLLLAVLLAVNTAVFCVKNAKESSDSGISHLVRGFGEEALDAVLPFAVFQHTQRQERSDKEQLQGWLYGMLTVQSPFFTYAAGHGSTELLPEDGFLREMLLKQESSAYKGRDGGEDYVILEEPVQVSGNAVAELEETDDELLALIEEENAAVLQQEQPAEEANGESGEEVPAMTGQTAQGFTKAAAKTMEYDWNQFPDYHDLISEFYAVDSTTQVSIDQVNLDNLLHRDLRISKDAPGPQILIYHTHSQEAFVDSVPGDESTTIMGAGERLARILEEQYGYDVLHHTGKYDVEYRDYAYSKSLPALEELLKENPSIQVIIDLHRDEMPDNKKLAVDLQGRPTAKFMFFNGLSYTNQTGKIQYLPNENLDDNLAFSFQMQVACNEYYPGLARRIYLKGYRYNMHLRPRTLLVELGAQTNTVEEITNALEPLAHTLDIVLSGE